MFSLITEILEIIADNGTSSEQRLEANNSLKLMLSFDYVFSLHLMRSSLGVANELSKELQRKDQYIVNATSLVKFCKQCVHMRSDSRCDSFLGSL